jgi:hypothetical protein
VSLRRKVSLELWAVLGWLQRNGLALGTGALGVLGWALLTDVLAGWLGGVVWEVSIGLLCFSLFGWRFAWAIASHGVYTLLKPKRQADK